LKAAQRLTGQASKTRSVAVQVEKQAAKVTGKAKLRISGAPSVVASFPGTVRASEVYETEVLALPTARLTGGIGKAKTVTKPVRSFAPSTVTIGRINVGTPKINVSGDSVKVVPDVKPWVGPAFTSRTTPIITSSSIPKIAPITASVNVVTVAPILKITSPKIKTPAFPKFDLGGGGGGGSSRDPLRGKWRKYKNPVKTYDKVLRDTIGFNANPKGVRFVNKVDKRLFKQVSKSNKRKRKR
jgi:hypothetical protein